MRLLPLVAFLSLPLPLAAQVRDVRQMTSPELARLDRARTVVILPGGILEEHGPYLPIYSDGYLNQRLADTLAGAIARRAGWTALKFPAIPLGNSGANDIGGKFSFSGTYAVRFDTLRRIYMDLADELGAQGFRWIFVVHLHGAPNHNRALDQAGDYFHETYGGVMVNLTGLMPVFAAIAGPKSPSVSAADGLPIHAGMDETSWVLWLQPALVRPSFRHAPPQADSTMAGLVDIASQQEWPGYFGAPRLATRRHGAAIWQATSDSLLRIARALLDGTPASTFPRFADVLSSSPQDAQLDAASLAAESKREDHQTAWLARRAREPRT